MLTLPLPVVHPSTSRRRVAGKGTRSVWRVLALAATATLHVLAIGVLLLPDRQPPQQQPVETVVVHEVEIALTEASAPPAPPPLPPPPPAARLHPAHAPTEAPPLPVPLPTPITPVLATPTQTEPAPATPAVATAATAAPVVTAPASTAPAAAPDRASAQAYMRLLAAALLQQRNYPGEARKQRLQGVVAVRFTLDRGGHVLAMAIARSSGHALLDQAALEVLQRADPLPAIPPELGKDRLTVTVPIEYSLITR